MSLLELRGDFAEQRLFVRFVADGEGDLLEFEHVGEGVFTKAAHFGQSKSCAFFRDAVFSFLARVPSLSPPAF